MQQALPPALQLGQIPSPDPGPHGTQPGISKVQQQEGTVMNHMAAASLTCPARGTRSIVGVCLGQLSMTTDYLPCKPPLAAEVSVTRVIDAIARVACGVCMCLM